MPHIIVKLWPGKSEEQKRLFAERIVSAGVELLGKDEGAFSVAMEEISPNDWAEAVYRPEIVPNMDKLYKKPGYKM